MCTMAIRNGLRIRPALDLGDEQLRSVGKLCVRPLGAAGLNPVARVGEQLIVSFLPTGSISVLNYGFLVNSAVGGTVFFRSVIVALVPRLTDAHNLGGQAEVRRVTGLGVPHHARDQPAARGVDGGARQTRRSRRRSIAAPSTWQSAELLGTVLIVYSISLVGQAMQRALLAPVLRAARHPHAAAECAVRADRQHGAAPGARAAVRPAQQERDHRRRARVLARAVRQRGHAWYRLTHTDGNPLDAACSFAVRLARRVGASAAAMIGASLVLNLGRSTRPRPGRAAHPHADRRPRSGWRSCSPPCTSLPAARSELALAAPAARPSSRTWGGRDRRWPRSGRTHQSDQTCHDERRPYTEGRQGIRHLVGAGIPRRRDAPRTIVGRHCTNRGIS